MGRGGGMEKEKRKKNQRKNSRARNFAFRAYRQATCGPGCGVRGGGTGTDAAVACYLHTWRAGVVDETVGGGGGRQALMPMHHAYSNPRHGTAVHGS